MTWLKSIFLTVLKTKAKYIFIFSFLMFLSTWFYSPPNGVFTCPPTENYKNFCDQVYPTVPSLFSVVIGALGSYGLYFFLTFFTWAYFLPVILLFVGMGQFFHAWYQIPWADEGWIPSLPWAGWLSLILLGLVWSFFASYIIYFVISKIKSKLWKSLPVQRNGVNFSNFGLSLPQPTYWGHHSVAKCQNQLQKLSAQFFQAFYISLAT